jgi:hypothetical protein
MYLDAAVEWRCCKMTLLQEVLTETQRHRQILTLRHYSQICCEIRNPQILQQICAAWCSVKFCRWHCISVIPLKYNQNRPPKQFWRGDNLRCTAAEYEFSNSTSLLHKVRAAATVLLALYFGRGFMMLLQNAAHSEWLLLTSR